MPAEKTRSFCPCSRVLNRNGKGLNSHPLLCMFLAKDLSGHSVASVSHCVLMTADFQDQQNCDYNPSHYSCSPVPESCSIRNSREVEVPIVMSWSRAPPAAAPTTAGNVMRCGASSATRHSNSETRRLTYGSGWLRRENSCGMMPFQGRVGVVASPDSSTVCSSRACLTISRKRRRVAVMVVQLFSIPLVTVCKISE